MHGWKRRKEGEDWSLQTQVLHVGGAAVGLWLTTAPRLLGRARWRVIKGSSVSAWPGCRTSKLHACFTQ